MGFLKKVAAAGPISKGLRIEEIQQGLEKHSRLSCMESYFDLYPGLKRFLKPRETWSCRRGLPGRSYGLGQRNPAERERGP